MPDALAIGVPYDVFFHLNPKKLKPFQLAYKRKLTEIDACIHNWFGNYGMSALGTVLSHMFDKSSTVEYISKPILSSEQTPSYKEANEEIAVYEMRQRIKQLEKQGLSQSPS